MSNKDRALEHNESCIPNPFVDITIKTEPPDEDEGNNERLSLMDIDENEQDRHGKEKEVKHEQNSDEEEGGNFVFPLEVSLKEDNDIDFPEDNTNGHVIEHFMDMENQTVNDEHVCHDCNESFQSPQQLAAHIIFHEAEKSNKCSHCEFRSTTQRGVKAHLRAVHNIKSPAPPPVRHICHICGKDCLFRYLLQVHIRGHTGEKPFKCSHCDFATAGKNSLRKHLRRLHPTEEQRAEQKSASLNESRKHQCGTCFKYFRDRSSLNRHRKTHHNSDDYKEIVIQESKVDGRIEYSCSICGKGFRAKSLLNRHCRIVHLKLKPKEPPAPVQPPKPKLTCPVCGKKLTGDSNLARHMRMHNGTEESFTCPFCEYQDMYRHKMKQHIAFSHPEEFKKTSKSNNVSPLFICPICNKKYMQQRRLTMHIAYCHKESRIKTVVQCPDCPQMYASVSGLVRHCQKHHPEHERLALVHFFRDHQKIIKHEPDIEPIPEPEPILNETKIFEPETIYLPDTNNSPEPESEDPFMCESEEKNCESVDKNENNLSEEICEDEQQENSSRPRPVCPSQKNEETTSLTTEENNLDKINQKSTKDVVQNCNLRKNGNDLAGTVSEIVQIIKEPEVPPDFDADGEFREDYMKKINSDHDIDIRNVDLNSVNVNNDDLNNMDVNNVDINDVNNVDINDVDDVDANDVDADDVDADDVDADNIGVDNVDVNNVNNIDIDNDDINNINNDSDKSDSINSCKRIRTSEYIKDLNSEIDQYTDSSIDERLVDRCNSSEQVFCS